MKDMGAEQLIEIKQAAYDRYMVSPERAAELLNWGDTGRAQVMKAKEVIYRQYGITGESSKEEYV